MEVKGPSQDEDIVDATRRKGGDTKPLTSSSTRTTTLPVITCVLSLASTVSTAAKISMRPPSCRGEDCHAMDGCEDSPDLVNRPSRALTWLRCEASRLHHPINLVRRLGYRISKRYVIAKTVSTIQAISTWRVCGEGHPFVKTTRRQPQRRSLGLRN